VDFFTPIVDDPYDFGRIAAANSLSDIYAMGATPLTALNIVCFPVKDLPKSLLKEILRGGVETLHEAGVLLVGGHSVEDPEPKYGLAVTGVVHPDELVTNSGARPGDHLILTKPIGTGVLATASKARLLSSSLYRRMVHVMVQLNKAACEAMQEVGVNAATDITGFGLVGHALDMAEASRVRIEISSHRVPLMEEAAAFLRQGLVPEGDYANQRFCEKRVRIPDSVDEAVIGLLHDAQTSGGLLISVPEEKASLLFARLLEKGLVEVADIGRIVDGEPGIVILP